jgi:hypothetical protein
MVPIMAGKARAALLRLSFNISLRFNEITSKDRIGAESVLHLLIYKTNLIFQLLALIEQTRWIVVRNM